MKLTCTVSGALVAWNDGSKITGAMVTSLPFSGTNGVLGSMVMTLPLIPVIL